MVKLMKKSSNNYDYKIVNNGLLADINIPVKYVHQLQQVLRLAGMTELANNFKIQLYETTETIHKKRKGEI